MSEDGERKVGKFCLMLLKLVLFPFTFKIVPGLSLF